MSLLLIGRIFGYLRSRRSADDCELDRRLAAHQTDTSPLRSALAVGRTGNCMIRSSISASRNCSALSPGSIVCC